MGKEGYARRYSAAATGTQAALGVEKYLMGKRKVA